MYRLLSTNGREPIQRWVSILACLVGLLIISPAAFAQPQPTGACCVGGICLPDLTESQCLGQGGIWQGSGTTCFPNPCIPLNYWARVEGGLVVEAGGDGWPSPLAPAQWILYPSNWLNMWWANEFTLDQQKEVVISFTISFPPVVPPPLVAFNYASADWQESSHPPLSADDQYVVRELVDPAITTPGSYTRRTVLPFCPLWVSMDVQGENYTIEGTITHVCLPAPIECVPRPDGMSCYDAPCLIPEDICLPTVLVRPAGSSAWTVYECMCANPYSCHLAWDWDWFCAGDCPEGQVCESYTWTDPTSASEYMSCRCSPLPQPEACCFVDGRCQDLDPPTCLAIDGMPQGPGTFCLGMQACCLPDGSCVMADAICCDDLGGIPQGLNSFCTEPQACCVPIMIEPGIMCRDLDPLCCDDFGGTPQGLGTVCGDQPPIACCLPDGTCWNVDRLCCDELGGTPGFAPQCLGDQNGNGIDDACETEACCFAPDGHCLDLVWTDCIAQGGTPQGPGTGCVNMLMACCVPDATGGIRCLMVDPSCCDDLGGFPAYQPVCLGDLNGNGIDDACEAPQPLEPKWSQPTHGGGQGFDAPSDLWWLEPESRIVWEQRPNPSLPGLPAHDWLDITGAYNWITLADDWAWPEGREVSDLHWWGNYELDGNGQEIRGAGVSHFHLSVHMCQGPGPQGYHVPMDPPMWVIDVPFPMAQESFTGLINSAGSRIYRYRFDGLLPIPPTWYYWLDVTAVSSDPGNPAMWRWQESTRRPYPPPPPEHPAPAAEQFNNNPWQTIMFGPGINTDLAFMVTSPIVVSPVPLPNKVVADDFISDGRPILALDWFGSYWDERYEPIHPPIEPYVLDGWLISFHHAEPYEWCPPGPSPVYPPTALAVYYAPMEAVEWAGLFMADCFGHGIYVYNVHLDRCCLLCWHEDPRLPDLPPPGRPDAFREVAGLRYWLGIQAVVGVKWIKPACSFEERILTGHLPSDLTVDGHFWGWHTSPVARLDEACTGLIMDFRPYPPECWDYDAWQKQPWLCPDTPVIPPVSMAFDLLAPPCTPLGDANGDSLLDLNDIDCFVRCLIEDYSVGCWCGCADLNSDGVADGLDIQPFVTALLGG